MNADQELLDLVDERVRAVGERDSATLAARQAEHCLSSRCDSAVATSLPHRGQRKPSGHLGSNRFCREPSPASSQPKAQPCA